MPQDAVRARIIAQGEEVPIEEACAMTTRVSPSFIRIGHFDLFGRLVDHDGDDSRRCLLCIQQLCSNCHVCCRRARQARSPQAKASAVEELRVM
jgi:hypothetical protein